MSQLAKRLGLVAAIRRREIGGDPARHATGFEKTLEALGETVPALNLDPAAVHLAAEIAALESDLDEERRIALVLLLLASMVAREQGSTRLPVAGDAGRAALRGIVGALGGGWMDEKGLARALDDIGRVLSPGGADRVIGRGESEYKPLLVLDGFLYQHRMHRAERRLADLVAGLLAGPAELANDRALGEAMDDLLARPVAPDGTTVVLSSGQQAAVRAVATARLTLISGGPGTGKTSIVLAILRLLLRLGIRPEEIALAAPTGKAAYRMVESIRAGLPGIRTPGPADEKLRDVPEASTLHRLLVYSPHADRFRHRRNNPLSQRVVIVDESSMIDLTLMESLAGAIGGNARLVLLGDADQLPSVDAGAVFRDLLKAFEGEGTGDACGGTVRCVRLRQNYRMSPLDAAGSAILSVAERVREKRTQVVGSAEDGLAVRRESADALLFEKVEFLDAAPGRLARVLDRWEAYAFPAGGEWEALAGRVYPLGPAGFEEEAARDLDRLLSHSERSRILCLTRVYETGSERINERLHARAARRAGRSADRLAFLAGEPVIVLRNDYARSLFNGDQGVVVWVSEQGAPRAPRVVFRRDAGFASFHLEMLRAHLDLCYAMTIHKAQGSEFDHVAVILPERDLPLLTREILYTAITRSRRSVILIGRESLLATGIERQMERYSGLSEKILETIARP